MLGMRRVLAIPTGVLSVFLALSAVLLIVAVRRTKARLLFSVIGIQVDEGPDRLWRVRVGLYIADAGNAGGAGDLGGNNPAEGGGREGGGRARTQLQVRPLPHHRRLRRHIHSHLLRLHGSGQSSSSYLPLPFLRGQRRRRHPFLRGVLPPPFRNGKYIQSWKQMNPSEY